MTRFEGTKVFLTETRGDCGDDTEAIYQVGLLENGSLRFVPIEDACGTRSGKMVEGEFEPFGFGPLVRNFGAAALTLEHPSVTLVGPAPGDYVAAFASSASVPPC